jgi:hypothetical protein
MKTALIALAVMSAAARKTSPWASRRALSKRGEDWKITAWGAGAGDARARK